MRVPVKITSFSCFLFSITFVQGQDITCTAPDIPNGLIVERMPEYQKGAILEYRCNPGFKKREGIPRCTKFGWTLKPECDEVTCELKSTTFGVKKINPEGKTIFRAGERVEITCSEKYWLIFTKETRKSFTCQYNGQWDSVPVCAEIRCEVPRDQHVYYTEYFFRGDKKLETKIYYYCESGYEKMAEEATCTQDGWTPKPLCAKMCPAPYIPNAEIVEGKRRTSKYQIYSKIKYQCRPGFEPEKPIEITCNSRAQWTDIQKCTARERVEITCSEKHWFFGTKETSKSFACQYNGQWDKEPVCGEIRCEVPRDQHVYNPGYLFRGDKKLETKIYYYCESGYEKMAEEATCTQDGWTPKPLCEKMCPAPYIPNAEIVEGKRRTSKYQIYSKIQYQCRPGFEPEKPIEITCNSRAQWTGIQHCTEKMCTTPDIPNAEIVKGQRQNYRINSRIEYKCSRGFEPEQPVQITCDFQGRWTGIQQCTEVCQFESTTPGVKGIIPEGKTIFKVGESLEIICFEKHFLFTKETRKSFTCQSNGKWDSKPVCEITCEVPHDQHVSGPEYYFSGNMKLGAKRSYSCKSGYRDMAEEATCTRDGWTPNPLCDEIMCDPPKIPNAEIAGGQKLKYKINSRIEYKCHPGFEPEEPVEITCDYQGQWTGIQQCSDGTCQEQDLNNIKIVFGHPSIDSPYKPGHSLIFQCTDDKMRFYGRRAIECLPDGRWNYPYPQCGGTVQCSKPTKNLQFVTLSDEKIEYSNSEMLTYKCKKPYNEIPGGVLMCQNGNWNGTFDCKSKICPPPPYLENGDFDTVSAKEDVTTAVSYTCQPYYVLTKQQDVYKCVDGKWETPPKCLRPCEIDDIVEKYNLKLPTEKVFIKHAEKYRLNCKVGWNTGSEMKAYVDVSCSNGNLQIDKSCDAQNNRK